MINSDCGLWKQSVNQCVYMLAGSNYPSATGSHKDFQEPAMLSNMPSSHIHTAQLGNGLLPHFNSGSDT